MSAVEFNDLSVGYRRHRVLEHLNLSLGVGKIHGLIGPNGCGKSTLVKTLVGLLKYQGTVTIGGKELSTIAIRDRAHEFAYVAQDSPVVAEVTGREVVTMGRYAHRSRMSALTLADEKAVDDALELTGAVAWGQRRTEATSGGERQLTHLARAIAQQAPLLVLDEPLSALDLAHQMRVLRLLKPWIAQDPENRTVIIVIHDLSTAARFCDELVLLSTGHPHAILAQGTCEEVLTTENVSKAFDLDVDIRRSPVTGSLTVTPL